MPYRTSTPDLAVVSRSPLHLPAVLSCRSRQVDCNTCAQPGPSAAGCATSALTLICRYSLCSAPIHLIPCRHSPVACCHPDSWSNLFVRWGGCNEATAHSRVSVALYYGSRARDGTVHHCNEHAGCSWRHAEEEGPACVCVSGGVGLRKVKDGTDWTRRPQRRRAQEEPVARCSRTLLEAVSEEHCMRCPGIPA